MKKGFTLIELLAVIVILAIIALIATPIILNIIDDSRNEANKRSIDMYEHAIENAIVTYMMNNNGEKPADLQTLFDSGLLDEFKDEEGNPTIVCDVAEIIDGKLNFDETTCKIDGNYVYDQEEGTATVGCTGKTIATQGTYTAGDLYDCTVSKKGEKHDFYILSNNNDGTVTMLMAKNLDGTVSWNDSAAYLTNQTSSWTITDDIAMPTVTQVGCPEFGESEYCYGTLPSYVTVNGANYWTTTKTDDGYWYVEVGQVYHLTTPDGEYCCIAEKPDGWCEVYDGVCHPVGYGVRPIITIDKDLLK